MPLLYLINLNTLISIRLDRLDRDLTPRLIKKYLNNNQEGFTLVELIVVVVIIGILSAIAIPSFQNASDKAKQKEPTVLIAGYLKAAQAYYIEYGILPVYTSHLGQYVSVVSCRRNYPAYCKNNLPRDYTTINSMSWTTPDGYFDIYMRIRSNKLTFRAMPVPVYQTNGFGVAGCYNPQTGATKVVEYERRMGRSIPYVDC